MATKNERFVRWQERTMAQMTAVLALFSGLSVGGIGLSFSLLQKSTFNPTGCYAALFLIAIIAFLFSSIASVAASLTRLLDFRLTALKVRKGEVDEPLVYFGTDASGYGRATWRLLWCTVVCLSISIIFLSITLAHMYLGKLLGAVLL